MKFTDILELAKKGYTPKDIKELLAIPVPEEEAPKQDPEPVEEPAPEEKPVEGQDPAESEDNPEMEALKKQVADLQAQLARQARPEPEKRDPEKELQKIALKFM